MDDERHVRLRIEPDILAARRAARELGARLGFTDIQLIEVATAISEIARNTLLYAREGEICVSTIREPHRTGMRIVASDRGPGIADLGAAMADGYSTGGGLGLGLPGAKRLMDAFEIASSPGRGTVVTMTKWGKR